MIVTPAERAYRGATLPSRTIELDGAEGLLILEALACLSSHGHPDNGPACRRLVYRLTGQSIDARPGAVIRPKVPAVPARVAAGARLLDECVPGWERHLQVPIVKFWARYSPDDPLTQLYGREFDMTGEAYVRGIKALGLRRVKPAEQYDVAAAHGFDTIWRGGSGYGPTPEQEHDYRLLGDAWTNLVEARLVARAGSPIGAAA